MLKCAPYIKSLCSSLHSGLWRDGTSSLPGSPIRHPVNVPSPTRSENAAAFASFNNDMSNLTQATISDDYDTLYVTKPTIERISTSAIELHQNPNSVRPPNRSHNLEDVKMTSLLSHKPASTTNTSSAVVSISENGDVVTSVIVNQPQSSIHVKSSPCGKPETPPSTSVKSDLIHVFKKIRPESPDVTRAAKKLEMARRLGAISKVPKQQPFGGFKDISTPPNSPSRR